MSQRPPADRPVFLYDGDCAFCTSCARFIERRIPTTATVVAWQHADLDELGVAQADAEAAVQWVPAPGTGGAVPGPSGAVAEGPEAIARLLVDAGGPWRPLGRALAWRPVLALAWPVYRWVSRNRHRMPGGTPACSLPQDERTRLRPPVRG
ncbi:MAG TPA: DCC1-like thiol-disulfide oxidoreductase family protein [Acidimicrobiales bacterium]